MTTATTETSENYLIAICTLTDEGEQPTLARLATYCGVTAPTMGEAARRLERDGLVRIRPRTTTSSWASTSRTAWCRAPWWASGTGVLCTVRSTSRSMGVTSP